MSFTKRFKAGLDVGMQAFGLLWKNKKLLIYLGAPILIGIAIELVAYNFSNLAPSSATMFMRGIMTRAWETLGWSTHIGLFLIQMIKLLVIIYATYALVYHINIIMNGGTTTIQKTVEICLPKLGIIAAWSALSTVAFVFTNYFDATATASEGTPCWANAALFSIAAHAAWSLATLFVVQALVLEKKPLATIISGAPTITKKLFPEYLGAIFWLGLIAVLALVPLAMLHVTNKLLLSLGYIVITLIISVALSSVHTIAKTILYKKFQMQKVK